MEKYCVLISSYIQYDILCNRIESLCVECLGLCLRSMCTLLFSCVNVQASLYSRHKWRISSTRPLLLTFSHSLPFLVYQFSSLFPTSPSGMRTTWKMTFESSFMSWILWLLQSFHTIPIVSVFLQDFWCLTTLVSFFQVLWI